MSTKRNIFAGGVGLLAIFLSVWAISAQDAAAPAAPPTDESAKIALLDVNKIFKENAPFKRAMEKLKNDADEADKKAKDAQKALTEMTTKFAGMSRGSDEYAEMQKKIVSSQTMLTTEIQLQRQDFLKREAKVYHVVYQEIESDVQKYADQNQISVVIRFMGDPVDENNPDSILANINKPVVWHNDKLDITTAIMQMISEKKFDFPVEEDKK